MGRAEAVMARVLIGAVSGLALAATLLACPNPADAQTEATTGPTESPQRFAFELRFGPYYPEVDESLSGSPYATVFGSRSDLLTEFEFDYQPTRIFVGTFAVGGAIGFMHAQAKAFENDSSNRSEDETNLWILPLSLLAVVRFDIFAERWSVPLVPFVKFGFTYAIWWTTNESGISEANGESGYGGTAGLRLGGGLMLRLDWIEPRAARTFDNEFGVNHSYIFFEYFWAYLDGFGSEERMNVGDSTWVVGLALEF